METSTNTYHKFVPNVFLAKCPEKHEKGSVINVTTKYGKENPSIVFNLIAEKEGYYYYSIVREDGFNTQEYAKRKAERKIQAQQNAEKKSTEYYNKSNKDRDFLSLAEPIKIGHHSEKRHRKIINEAWNNMGKSVEFQKKADSYNGSINYWESRVNDINLSMPESLEFYEYQLKKAKEKHEFYKNNPDKREHSFSLTYAKKEVNEITKKLKLAKRLWE